MADNTLRFDFIGRDKVSPVIDKVEGKFASFGSKMKSFGKGAGLALLGVGTAMVGVGVAGVTMGIKTAASLEQAQIGFSALLGSGKKAHDFLADLQKFAASTPFELPGLIESSRTLIGVGLTTKETKAALQAFGDTAGAVGIGQDNFQRIMLATAQSISAGKIKLGDMNQLMNNGIPIWKLLSEALHKPVPEIQSLISHGKLLTKDVLPKLEAQMEKDYGGAMAKQSATLSGLWSTLMDTINLGLANVLVPLIPTIKNGVAGAIKFLGAVFSHLPGIITTAMGALGTVKDYIVKTVVPGITEAFGTIKSHLPTINLADIFATGKNIAGTVAAKLLPVAGAILKAAQDWGGKILTGLNMGLSKGDWGPLGRTLGEGLVSAISGAASLAQKVARAVANFLGGIDWLEVGKTVGVMAFPFAIGFFNTLLDGLWTAIRQHPMDVVLFIAAFIPLGKFAAAFGPLRNLISHLPLGKWFIAILDHTAVPVFDAVMRFLKFIGGGFAKGFSEWFPSLTGKFSRLWSDITTEIGARALYAFAAAKDFVGGIAHGIGSATGGVVHALGSLIVDMIRPFARAGSWLIDKGVALVTGLSRGVASMLGNVARGIRVVIDFLLSPFRPIGRWLLDRGSQLIGGLTSGIRGMLGNLARGIRTVIDYATNPFRSIGRWLVDRGSQLIRGLSSGIRSMFGALGQRLTDLKNRVTGFFGRTAGWLFNAGYNVLWGFWQGLKAIWSKVTGWVGGIASWIRDHKGPISLDAKLLIPAGMAIMTGFYNGLKSGAGRAWDYVKGVGGKTKDAIAQALGYIPGVGWVEDMLGGAPTPGYLGGGGRSNVLIGKQMAASMGWSGAQWSALYNLFQGESGWNNHARNPSSGAYGIPQSLPASKMGRAANPPQSSAAAQIAWGLGYIKSRYGSPLNAYGQWLRRSPHWYDRGGLARGPGLFMKGPEPERILSPKQTVWFERAMASVGRYGAGRGNGSVTFILNAPNYVGSRDELLGEFNRFARQGRLDPIIKAVTR